MLEQTHTPSHSARPADPTLVLIGGGAIALLLAAAALLIDVRQFFQGYLFGWCLWVGPMLGSAALLMTHPLTSGRWGWVIRRPLRASVSLLPAMCVAFVPILVGVNWLYPWMHQSMYMPEAIVQFKQAYLQPWFFYLRTVVYLLIWSGGAWALWRASAPGRQPSQPFSCIGLIVFVLTSTFAFYDWNGTLEPHWYSTIYGMYAVIGQLLSAMCLMILITSYLPQWTGKPSAERLHDLGNMLLALVVLWAYMAYSQFFIIWNGDLPEQISWYVHRTQGAWAAIAVIIILIHFVLPFGALLLRIVKRTAQVLAIIAALVLTAHTLDVLWRIIPAFHDTGIGTLISAIGSSVGIGCFAAAGFRRAVMRDGPHQPPEADDE